MIGGWWNHWIWAGERRRHGPALVGILAAWRPAGGAREGSTAPWARDERLLNEVLAVLWQGGTRGDLARVLDRLLAERHRVAASEEELADLSGRLVAAYESRIFGGSPPEKSS